ncbi:MAG: hypothetical protein DBX59_08580 [Bacillota bacterium]|nr:MAG: hypothetical protein DBX59_08580 [Bacillota bacterium]
MKKRNWYPLDNAAKIFPAVYGEKRPYNFCFSAILSEKVEPEKLNTAVNQILNRVPTFKTKLKRGVFWYYLEENKKPFRVSEEVGDYLGLIDFSENNDYLFKVFYREYKISLVVFHALSDGNGGLEVFKQILLEYFRLLGKQIDAEGLIKTGVSPENFKERSDNYVSNYKKAKVKIKKPKKLAHSDGTAFDYDGFGLITATTDSLALKDLAKKYKATVTEFLSGVYLYVFYTNYVKGMNAKNKNVCILVPVDMRRKYSSESLRNFSLFVRVTHYFDRDYDLEECVKIASEKMREGLDEKVLDSINHFNVSVEKNVLLKIVPLFLKDVVLRIGYHFEGENLQSGDLSNVGLVELPEDLARYVRDINFSISASHTSKQLVAAVGYNGKVNITFTRNFTENGFERDFIGVLAQNGLDIVVKSNYWEKKL